MSVVTLPTPELLAAVRPPPGIETVLWDGTSAPDRAREVRVVVAPYMAARGFLRSLGTTPSVELVQLQSAGYDDVVPLLPPGVTLANAAGVHDAATAELAIGLVISSLRDLPAMVRAQDARRWLPKEFRPSLADRRVLVVGYGGVGRAVARRLAPFEVELSAVATTARPGDDTVARLHAVDELPHLLPEHDVVVLTVPLTERTKGLVDEHFLTAMPDGALLVNVARGAVVDTDALVAHAGRLRVALDVTDPEPLPSDHGLWTAPRTIITPHVGGVASSMFPRMVRVIERQLAAAGSGGEWINTVHRG